MITIFFSSYQGKPKIPLFFFLKILPFSHYLCFSLKTFPISPLRPLFFFFFFFLSPFFSFSLGAKPSETPRFFLHAFRSLPTESPPRISQKLFFSLNVSFFPSFFFPLPHQHPHHPNFLSFSALKILTFSLETPTHSAPPFPRSATALHTTS